MAPRIAVKKQELGAFEDDDVCFPRNRREYKDFQRFDRAMKDAQSGNKEQVTKSVNLAAQIAAGLSSTDGIRHVVSRICLISKDGTTRKETAVYATDSIMRHVASGADEMLLERYEKHLQSHLRNIFKRSLRTESTRKWLAERFLMKILPKWAEKGWFRDEIAKVVEVVHNSAPSVKRPEGLSADALAKRELPFADADSDYAETEAADEEPKPGASAMPPQPAYPAMAASGMGHSMAPHRGQTPAMPLPGGMTPMLQQHGMKLQMGAATADFLQHTPMTPGASRTPGFGAATATPFGSLPMTPNVGGDGPMTPTGAIMPMTPGVAAIHRAAGRAGMVPSTPKAAGASPSTPRTSAAVPFAPSIPGGAQPGTPRIAAAAQPFTPKGAIPGTPLSSTVPFMPAGATVQPFAPKVPPATIAQEQVEPGLEHPVPSVPTETGAGAATPFMAASSGGFGPGTPGLPDLGQATPLLAGSMTPALGDATPAVVLEQPAPSVPSVPSQGLEQPVPSATSVPTVNSHEADSPTAKRRRLVADDAAEA